MSKTAVINASPLIFLSRGHHISLLSHFADNIVVPKPVADEIMARGSEDKTALSIRNTSWIKTAEIPVIPETIIYWGLGQGESSVLAYAQAHPGVEAIIDDLAGRKCAASLGIPVSRDKKIVGKHHQHLIIKATTSPSRRDETFFPTKSVGEKAFVRVCPSVSAANLNFLFN